MLVASSMTAGAEAALDHRTREPALTPCAAFGAIVSLARRVEPGRAVERRKAEVVACPARSPIAPGRTQHVESETRPLGNPVLIQPV